MVEMIPVENKSEDPYLQKQYITKRDKEIYDYFRNFLYLNGYVPKKSEVCKYFDINTDSLIRSYVSLTVAGLFIYELGGKEEPRLTEFMAGMCRVPFKGEVSKGGINLTKETMTNFYDLVNTPDFITYRLMFDLKLPYYKVGDYLILSKSRDYDNDVVLLCYRGDKPMICRYHRRTHDCILLDYGTGETIRETELTTIGEIVGSIRMELPYEKLFLKSRVKVTDE